jgi:hypothetical protein
MKTLLGMFIVGSFGCSGGGAGAGTVLLPGETFDAPASVTRSCDGLPNDAFQLNQAMTVDTEARILRVSVAYSGGCAEHTFAACWNGAISKSKPATFSLSLHHDNAGDDCDAFITRDLFIDLSSTPAGFGSPEGETSTTIRLTEL